MWAPKRPVATGTPSAASSAANAATNRSPMSGGAASVKPGRLPRRTSA